MALQKNKRSLLNKDEEDEKKKKVGGFMLPTYEELSLIEQQAKEDAAAAASSMVRNNMVSDLGRTSAQAARNEIAERAADLNAQKKAEEQLKIDAQKQKVEEAQREYDAYSVFDKIGIGTSAKMADIAKDQVKKQQAEYDRMTMTEREFEKAHKADFGETIDRFAESAGYGIAKSFGSAVDTTKAIGAGIAAGFANFDSEKFSKSFNRAYQKSLTDGTSLYDEIDAEYQRERAAADEVDGRLNVFTSYVDQAAHSAGEQAVMFWAASMATGIAGGAKVFSAVASKADDMIAGGGKVAKAVGSLLKKVNAGTIGGATSMFVASSAQATKEAVSDMRGQNAGAAAFGMPQRYTEEEIESKAAVYGLLNGLSESVLEYALGGLTGAQGASKAVKNPLLTALGNYVKGSLGEGVEEITQSLASYGLKRAIYDENAELDWREVIDSGIVGAITGFGMGLTSAVKNTRAAVDAQTTIHKVAKDANNAKSEIDRAKVIFEAEAVARSSEDLAKKMRELDSEGAEALVDIIAWQGEQARKIADMMEAKAAETSSEGTGEANRIWDDNNTDHAEIERTGRESGAADDDIRMAGELSTVLGKKIRFFREDVKNGTINNGEYHGDTGEIWINTRSKNVKAQIVAHELTHSIEKNDGYQKLVDLAMNKLEEEQKAKGKTLDDLYREKETLYADGGVRLASYDEITSELVAEFVERRLLTDEASIKSLVSENRTLGQRIREWFDSLLAKMGNASAKEREYIRQMRDVYARALGEDVGAGADGVQHHISKTEKGQPFVTIDRDILAGVPQSDWQQTVVDNLTGKYPNGIKIGNQQIQITEQGIDEIAYSKQAQWLYKNDINTLTDKYRASDNADEIVRSAQGWINEGLNHKRKDDIVDFARGKTLIRVGKNDYEADVLVARLKNDDLTLYDIYNLSPTTIKEKETGTVMNSNPSPSGIRNPANISSGNSISQNVGNVKGGNAGNTPHSISKVDDQRYKEAVDRGDMETAQKMVDEAARAAGWIPVTRYHQTGAQFTRFSNENPDAGLNDSDTPNGFFFKENDHDIGVGGDYVKTGHGGEIQMPVYLKTENVLSFKNRDEARSWYTKNVPGYMELLKKYEEYQAEYKRLDNENTGKMFEELELLDESGEYTASKADAVMKKYDAVIDDWIEKTKDYETGLRSEMRKLLNDFFLNGKSEYDAIELEDDGHRYIDGKREDVHTYIVFKNTQIKSSKPVTYDDNGNVIPLSERFKRDNDDIRHSVTREDASVTEAETDQTLQQIRNDIAADEARYRELSDTVMSNERFNAMMPDEQNEILDEMQSLRERIDRANQIVQDMSYEQDMGDDVPAPGDESDPLAGVSSAVETEVEELDVKSAAYDGYKMSVPEVNVNPKPQSNGATAKEKETGTKEQFTREDAMERYEARKKKREERKTVAKAETAFKRLGYDIDGAIVDNYEDAQGIIEDNRLAAQAGYDVERYIKANNITPIVDTAAKMIATDAVKPTEAETGVSGQQLELAKELAELYKQRQEIMQNNIREQGKKNTNIVNDRLDQILGGYDWYSAPNKSRKFWRQQLQLSLSNPEQVIRDVFGEGAVADELNDYIIKPTVENSARARRQTNKMVSGLRDLGLNESESAVTQIFSEYSNLKESGSKKAVLSETTMRDLLLGGGDINAAAEKIARKEYGRKENKEKKEFRDSIIEQFQNEINVNQSRARQRALRDYKEQGGTAVSWNALSEDAKKAKIDAAYKTVTEESIGRIVEGTKELRKLLDDMYEAINQISVIHGADPIKFRRGYMPHSHKQTEELQKWFNDHMGGLNVTPVQDLPTDIAGKTADRKPNKRWFSHAQERTGPRTTWDALGNIEDYLRIANDTIYHMDDIRKMRVLERYIRGIYSVARGATGEEQRTRVRNDVMQRMHGTDDDLVFLGLKKPEQKQVSDEDMDLSQMTTFVTWLTNYTNDLAAKQIFNRDIEAVAGRKYNNLANTITSWSSRVMMQYNISSNLKQLSQLGTVAGDVGASITKDAAALTARSMRDLGNGTNELEQKYHISERSTFLAEKQNIEEATFASDHDLTEAQRAKRDKAAEIWDYAWSFTDTTMSRFAVYSYFLEGMKRGMNDTDALAYADSKARNILASRMKGSSPLIFQSKNPILRLFTMFQREPLAAWEDVLKTIPREYAEYKEANGDKAAKEWITKRVTGRILGASMTNAAYLAMGLGTPAMFDILGTPLSAILEKVIGDLTEDEEDDQTWGEMLKGFGNNLKNEIADDIPFASLIAAITNTAAGTDFESRLPINAPDIDKLFAMFTAPADVVKLTAAIANADDAETIEALQEDRADAAKQIPFAMLSSILEIIGTAAPAGNQIRKSASGLIAVLRGGEYTSDGRLKYEVGGLDAVRAVTLGKSNTKAAREWVEEGFGSYSEAETDAYHALVSSGVSKSKAAKYVNAVTDAEKQEDETKAQAEARILDGLQGLNDDQRAELYYELVATDSQIEAIDAAISAGADKTSAVKAARSIRELSKRADKVDALIASDMVLDAKRAVYDRMITDEDGDKIDALDAVGLDFEDFLAAKAKQSALNADESITASKRATRFMAWIAEQGYTDEQEETVSDTFAFASGFKVQAKAYEDLVAAGVKADNAVTVTDALSGTSRAIDKINAIWSTGLTGEQLDTAIKVVVTEGWYERYRTVIDANVPLDVLTWVLDNADQNGNDSIDNEERTLILSQLALSRKELSALWIATGGSEKSNPWGSGSTTSSKTSKVNVKTPTVKTPSVKTPSVSTPKININVPYFGFDLEE